MRCNGSNWAVYSPGSWDGFRNDLWALWAGVIMRLAHHLVGGYVRYISPHIIIIIIIILLRTIRAYWSKCWVVPPVLFRTNYYSIEIPHGVTAISLTYHPHHAKLQVLPTCNWHSVLFLYGICGTTMCTWNETFKAEIGISWHLSVQFSGTHVFLNIVTFHGELTFVNILFFQYNFIPLQWNKTFVYTRVL